MSIKSTLPHEEVEVAEAADDVASFAVWSQSKKGTSTGTTTCVVFVYLNINKIEVNVTMNINSSGSIPARDLKELWVQK